MSQAFEQLQQVRGYYSVAPVLDVDRYEIDGETRDLVLGVRELDQAGLVADQRNWANEHTVYTHGYGVDRGLRQQPRPPTTRRAAERRAAVGGGGPAARAVSSPTSPDRTATSRGSTSARRARRTPSSARPRTATDVELDIPEEASGERGTTTYDGDGRRRGRRLLQQAALRDQVRRAEHPAVEPGQRELEDPLRAAPARARARRSRRG